MKGEGALENLASLVDELPKKGGPSPARLRRKRHERPSKVSVQSAVVFPECFAEVTRLAGSKSADDARKRAALEAVASTLPDNARSASGAKAAGIYLASLIVALRQVLASFSPKVSQAAVKQSKKNSAKLSKKQQRLQQAREERGMLEMSAMDARESTLPSKDVEMIAQDSIPEPCEQEELSEDARFIANIVYLISLAVRSSSRNLLNAKARDILIPIREALAIPSPSPLLARHAATVISSVISVLDAPAWSSVSSDISFAYLTLLSIAASSTAKNRRKAREELVNLLRKVPVSYFRSSCSRVAVSWFERTTDFLVNECSKITHANAKDRQGKLITQLLHHVSVFRYFVFACNSSECALIAKQLVTLAQSPIREIFPFCHDGLAFLFSVPKNVTNDAGLLASVYVNMVAETFSTGLPDCETWLQSQHPKILLRDAEKLLAAVVASKLPTACSIKSRTSRARALVTMVTGILQYYPHTPPPPSATLEVVRVLVHDIDPTNLSVVEVKQLSHYLHAVVKRKEVSAVPGLLNLLEPLCLTKFQRHWNSLLPIMQDYLAEGSIVVQPQSRELITDFLRKLIEERTAALAANKYALAGQTESLIGSVVRGGGVSYILEILPVEHDEKTLVTNAWVLGILKDKICHAPLMLWKEKFFPLHRQLEESSKKLCDGKRFVESKNVKIYSHQILALLPGLCSNPSDLSHSQAMNIAFAAIHYCITYSESLVQRYGCTALRSLSESIQTACGDDKSASTSGLRSSFSSRLKKLFPFILSLSEKQNPEKRGALLPALTIASQACGDSGLVLNLLRKTIRRFLEAATKDASEMDTTENEDDLQPALFRIRHSASDLSIAIIESGVVEGNASEFDLLKRAVLPLLKSKADSTLQKKAYRILSALINSGAIPLSKDAIAEIVEELVGSAPQVTAGSVSSRLAMIETIIRKLASSVDDELYVESMQHIVSRFLPESVLALKENSVKSRQSGLSLIKSMAEAWNKSEYTDLGLENFLIAIAAGLGGQSPAMVSGTLVAMGCFLQEFKVEVRNQESLATIVDSMFARVTAPSDNEMVDSETESNVVGSPTPGPIAILIRHDALEVQRSAIGVVKVAIAILGSPLSRLLKLLPGFLPSLVATATNSKKREIRLRVKLVIERLLRKCGREVMEDLFPSDHLRLLSSVRKAHEKEKQKRKEERVNKLQAGDGDDDYADFGYESDDSDDEKAILDGNELIARKQRQSIRNSRIVQEKAGEVLDLLGNENIEIDQDLANKASSQPDAPSASRTKSINRNLDTESADAPLVFVEDDDDDKHGKESDGENSDGAEETALTKSFAGRKRRREHNSRNDGYRKKGRSTAAAGAEYSSKKGAGDRKLSNRPDPYAYLPLSSSLKNISSSSVGKGAKAKRRSGKPSSRK